MPKKDPFLRFSEALKTISLNMKPTKYDAEARFSREFGELYNAFLLFKTMAKEGIIGSDIRMAAPEYDPEEHSVCVELTAYAPLGERTTIFFIFMDGFVFTQSDAFNESYSKRKIARWKPSQISDLIGKLSDFFVDFYKTTVPHFSGEQSSNTTGRQPLPRSRV
ncbi:hypothetical protein MKK55_26230 [Methylobacterium sp. J-059]|uniref:hypothetical protein n=1 Tax=Methylobacterium sp. J-059 TaxID=2836643 RepID=UPI001FBAF0A3|nr:hypothetical protein [Methylobacterium sp. J-059]MCJ2042420.1 hypothetical protein [Methylobacterium sp. J-059]